MIDVECRAELILKDADGRENSLSAVVPLLQLVLQTGAASRMPRALRVCPSYRHAWGLLREIEIRLGGGLITKSRGRGSVLPELGKTVLRAERMNSERLEMPLQTVANDVGSELNRRLSGAVTQLRIHASHGYAVATLVRALGEQRVARARRHQVSRERRGRQRARAWRMRTGGLPLADRAGPLDLHRNLPAASRPGEASADTPHLAHARLFLPKGNPKGIEGLRDLARRDVRFVNRQLGSGTRMLLDLSLRGVGVDPEQINGYAITELTHSAIAAFVESSMADLGFGVQPAAQHFALDFIPVVDEDYFFACERARLDKAQLGSVCASCAATPSVTASRIWSATILRVVARS